MKRVLAAIVLVLSVPCLARAADDAGTVARARAAVAQLPASDAAALMIPLDEAAAKKFPVAPVAEKILEGLAKHAPAARVAAAATQVVTRLDDSAAALETAQVPAANRDAAMPWLVLAEARLGSRDALLLVAQSARGASGEALVAAATACAELRDAGVPEAKGAPVLGRLAARGFGPEQLEAVPALYRQYKAECGTDDRAFLDEVLARGVNGGNLHGLVDPFAPHGNVLDRQGLPTRPSDALPGQPPDTGQGTVAGNYERGGSAPTVDDDLAARQGGQSGAPPNGATGSKNGKAKGAGNGNSNGNSNSNPGKGKGNSNGNSGQALTGHDPGTD